jgi:hypothetical protein
VTVDVLPEVRVTEDLLRLVVNVGDGSPLTVKDTVGALLLRELNVIDRVVLPPGATGSRKPGADS